MIIDKKKKLNIYNNMFKNTKKKNHKKIYKFRTQN